MLLVINLIYFILYYFCLGLKVFLLHFILLLLLRFLLSFYSRLLIENILLLNCNFLFVVVFIPINGKLSLTIVDYFVFFCFYISKYVLFFHIYHFLILKIWQFFVFSIFITIFMEYLYHKKLKHLLLLWLSYIIFLVQFKVHDISSMNVLNF